MNWDVADFALFAAMLAGAGGAYGLAALMMGSRAYRAAVGMALAAAFLLTWVTLAVGFIGSEDNPANRMVGLVLGVGIIGAAVARAKPAGMARTLYATALAQALVAVVALIAGPGSAGAVSRWDVLVATGFFVALWLLSARLFRKAAREQVAAGAAWPGTDGRA